MATIREILAKKGTHVWSIGKDMTVLQAVLFMNEHQIGAAVVIDEGHIAGMFTERDLLRRVVGEQRDPATTQVAAVMTTEVFGCKPETAIEEARGTMKNRRLRHLPVVDGDGNLLGLISIGDLNAFQVAHQEQTIHLLHEYLYGRV
jgi:CBS domain-containing protein